MARTSSSRMIPHLRRCHRRLLTSYWAWICQVGRKVKLLNASPPRGLRLSPVVGEPSLLYPHGAQILEPGLGLDESLHFGPHGPWIQIVHDEHPRRILDDGLMRPRQESILLLRVERGLRGFEQSIHFGIIVRHDIRRPGWGIGAVEATEEGAVGLHEVQRDVHATQMGTIGMLKALEVALDHGIPLD